MYDGVTPSIQITEEILTKDKVTGTRLTNPAVDLHELPRIDLICLSHYHACVSSISLSSHSPSASSPLPSPCLFLGPFSLYTQKHHSPLSSDHFDDHVEATLRRSLPIITTPHAKSHLTAPHKTPEEAFTSVHDLDFYDDILVDIASNKKEKKPAIKVTGMPGKHVPPGPGGVVGKLNDLIAAVSPMLLASINVGAGED